MASVSHSSRVEDLLQLHPSLWRAHQLGAQHANRIPTGFPELNAQLPDLGWPCGNLIELLLRHHGIGELRFLIPALRTLALQQKKLVFMNPPFLPVPAVMELYGIPAHAVVRIDTPKPHDRLWAVEQLIRSDSFGALIVWLPEGQCSRLENHQLRRLQYQAQQSSGACFLFRPIQAQTQASPAPLRMTLNAHSPDVLRVQIIKRRGPILENPLFLTLPGNPLEWCQRPVQRLDTEHKAGHTSEQALEQWWAVHPLTLTSTQEQQNALDSPDLLGPSPRSRRRTHTL